MNNEANNVLSKEYTLTLSGAAIGYLVQLLADAQFSLNEGARLGDVQAKVLAAANDVVGNEMLHAVYASSGSTLLSYVMKTDAAALDKLMKARTLDEIQEAGEALGSDPDEVEEAIQTSRALRKEAKASINRKYN